VNKHEAIRIDVQQTRPMRSVWIVQALHASSGERSAGKTVVPGNGRGSMPLACNSCRGVRIGMILEGVKSHSPRPIRGG
jgi:hypothetical protein